MSSKTFVDLVADLIAGMDSREIDAVAGLILAAGETSGRIYIAGNGGSAATAQHFHNDLVGLTLKQNHHGSTPMCLSSNMSLFSALSNDYGYDKVFLKQVEGRIGPGDLLILFSVSGASPNCMEVARYARRMGAVVIGMLGFDGGALAGLSDHKIVVRSDNYFAVESCHLVIAHAVTERLESALSVENLGTANKSRLKVS